MCPTCVFSFQNLLSGARKPYSNRVLFICVCVRRATHAHTHLGVGSDEVRVWGRLWWGNKVYRRCFGWPGAKFGYWPGPEKAMCRELRRTFLDWLNVWHRNVCNLRRHGKRRAPNSRRGCWSILYCQRPSLTLERGKRPAIQCSTKCWKRGAETPRGLPEEDNGHVRSATNMLKTFRWVQSDIKRKAGWLKVWNTSFLERTVV